MTQITDTLFVVIVPEGAHSFYWLERDLRGAGGGIRKNSNKFTIGYTIGDKGVDYKTAKAHEICAVMKFFPPIKFPKTTAISLFLLADVNEGLAEQFVEVQQGGWDYMNYLKPLSGHTTAIESLYSLLQSKGVDTSKPETILLIQKQS
jgi:hypothetical protein